MKIDDFVIGNYKTVPRYTAVSSIENELKKTGYMVVVDEENRYEGILTASDLAERPHKLVIDCITEKERIISEKPVMSIIEKFQEPNCVALPVFKDDDFLGIAERKQMFDALSDKIGELDRQARVSKKTKSAFLNSLAHEIRTPLNSILGFLELIGSVSADPDEFAQKDNLEYVKKSASKFLALMDDLIELSLIHAGEKIDIDSGSLSLSSFFRNMKLRFSAPISKKKKPVRLILPETDDSLRIETDERRLTQIMFRLVENAVMHSEDGIVEVDYRFSSRQNSILFFVNNEVADIDSPENLFNLFGNLPEKKCDKNSGIGTGLPLAKALTEKLGGFISINGNKNQLRLCVNLPLSPHK